MARSESVEILVHIEAPSKFSDDLKYRQLATAYIDFKPTSLIHISEAPRSQLVTAHPSTGSYSQTRAEVSDGPGQAGSTAESIQASFRSVIDNTSSPFNALNFQQHRAPSQVTQSSSISGPPPSIVADSNPENAVAITSFTSPTRVLESYLQNFDTQSDSINELRSSEPQSPEVQVRIASARLDRGHAALEIIEIACTPKSAPNYVDSGIQPGSASHPQAARSKEKENSSPASMPGAEEIIEDTVIISPEQVPRTPRADSEPPPTKKPRLGGLEESPRSLLRTSSDIGPRSSSGASSKAITFLNSDYSFESLEIHSVDPSTGCDTLEPTSLITPGLEKLAHDLQIPKRFRPRTQTRDLRPFERGYWRLDCADWDPTLKLEAWAFLANYIGSGTAGWGISCRRDSEFHSMRVYCWGAVTAHIFLLLYIASQRHVLSTGASWVDGDGTTVIVMDSRSS